MTTTASKEVVKESNKPVFSEGDLTDIDSFNAAVALLGKQGVTSESVSDYGSGFKLLKTDEKVQLIGVPFVIVEWQFRNGDNGEYVSALIVTAKDEKLILNDGSTGIRDQLRKVTDARIDRGQAYPQQGLACEKGLRVSKYTYTDAKTGEDRPAETFYLA